MYQGLPWSHFHLLAWCPLTTLPTTISPIWWLYKTYLQLFTSIVGKSELKFCFLHKDWKTSRSLSRLMLRDEPGGKIVQSFKSSAHSLGIWFAALARRTAPGLGYGRCWKRGPDAVVSAPVFASLCFGKPLDQVPLQRRNSFVKDRKMFAEARTCKSALFKRWTLFF